MPSEKFYPQHISEDDPREFIEVAWHRDYDGVHLVHVKDTERGREASSIPVDRSGINRLIKVLRKARDQTYGADE